MCVFSLGKIDDLCGVVECCWIEKMLVISTYNPSTGGAAFSIFASCKWVVACFLKKWFNMV